MDAHLMGAVGGLAMVVHDGWRTQAVLQGLRQ